MQEVTCDLMWHSKARVRKTTGSSLRLMAQFPCQSLQSSCPHSMPSHICAWVTLSSPPFSFHFHLLLLFLSFEGHCSLASTSDCVPFAHWNTVIWLIGQYSEYSITDFSSNASDCLLAFLMSGLERTHFEKERKKVKSLSHVRLFVTPRTVAHQAPPSMGFPRQEYWSGLSFPSPEHLPDSGIEPKSPAL